VPKPSDIVIGRDNAQLTVVEYASLSCPHCAHFFADTLPKLDEKYIKTGKVRLVYRDYPLNPTALKGAMLLQCVDKDRRHEFLTVLFKMQDKWAFGANYIEALSNIAAFGGFERARFNQCIDNKKVEQAVLEVAKEASDDYKIEGTPTFFINVTKLKGGTDIDSFSKIIDAALAAQTKK
jgi:protein-disulfide isomerase